MSYILDALRKADAQRESDPARGIHAQPVRAAIGEHRTEDGYRTAFWAATGAGLAALAAVGWYLYRDSAAPQAPAAPAGIAAAAPVPAMKPVPAAAPTSAAVATTAVASAPRPQEPAVAVLPPPVVVVAPVAAPPHPVAKAAPAPARLPAAKASAEMRTGPGAPAVAAAASNATPPIAGLPSDAPKLAISGGVYSANASQRMLIVNGQVFNEGSEIGPAVVLEEIKPKAAVVRFRGSRYTVGF